MKNLPINPEQIEQKKEKEACFFHESKIQWEIPKFEEIDLEGGNSKAGFETALYRS